jgi:hypothetical protein
MLASFSFVAALRPSTTASSLILAHLSTSTTTLVRRSAKETRTSLSLTMSVPSVPRSTSRSIATIAATTVPLRCVFVGMDALERSPLPLPIKVPKTVDWIRTIVLRLTAFVSFHALATRPSIRPQRSTLRLANLLPLKSSLPAATVSIPTFALCLSRSLTAELPLSICPSLCQTSLDLSIRLSRKTKKTTRASTGIRIRFAPTLILLATLSMKKVLHTSFLFSLVMARFPALVRRWDSSTWKNLKRCLFPTVSIISMENSRRSLSGTSLWMEPVRDSGLEMKRMCRARSISIRPLLFARVPTVEERLRLVLLWDRRILQWSRRDRLLNRRFLLRVRHLRLRLLNLRLRLCLLLNRQMRLWNRPIRLWSRPTRQWSRPMRH